MTQTSILLDQVKQTGSLFGINICNIEYDTEWDDRIIRLYVA